MKFYERMQKSIINNVLLINQIIVKFLSSAAGFTAFSFSFVFRGYCPATSLSQVWYIPTRPLPSQTISSQPYAFKAKSTVQDYPRSIVSSPEGSLHRYFQLDRIHRYSRSLSVYFLHQLLLRTHRVLAIEEAVLSPISTSTRLVGRRPGPDPRSDCV